MRRVKEIQKYFNEYDLEVTDIRRLRYSGGVMSIVEINDRYKLHTDKIWTGYWTKKWKSMTDEEFGEWALPKVIKYVNGLNPDESLFGNNITDLAHPD